MEDESREVNEITITAEKENRNVVKNEMSVQKLEMKTIKRMPSLMGEVDVIKAYNLCRVSNFG